MAVTLRKDAKSKLIYTLREQGYPTYARLLDYFDVYITDDPEVVGYMVPRKAKVVLNGNLDMDQVSTVVRHEILHEYLTHMERQQDFHSKHGAIDGKPGKYPVNHKLSNIAGDFEISNLGYTDADKREMKRLKLNGQTLQGLVTELDRPGWENLSYEQMYEKLLEEQAAAKEALENLLERIDKLNKEDMDDLDDGLEELEDEGSESASSEEGEEDKKSKGGSSEDKKDGEEGEEGDKGAKAKQAIADAAEELRGQLKDLKGKQQEIKDYQQSDGSGGFLEQEDQRDLLDISARVAQIEKAFKDLKMKSDMLDEVHANKEKEKAVKAARDTHRFNKSGLQQFKLTLNRFIMNELEDEEKETPTRIHPSYEDSDIILPGRRYEETKKIPVINVYWDASGSFSPPEKTAAARRAIETLNKYVRRGQLVMNVWYHGNKISDTFEGAGGGNKSNIVEQHILQTKPDNVIVITDGDLSNDTLKATVPGAVWMLFYDRRSSGLMNSLHGKRETKYFDIEYRNI